MMGEAVGPHLPLLVGEDVKLAAGHGAAEKDETSDVVLGKYESGRLCFTTPWSRRAAHDWDCQAAAPLRNPCAADTHRPPRDVDPRALAILEALFFLESRHRLMQPVEDQRRLHAACQAVAGKV